MKHKIELVYNQDGTINIKKSVKDHYTALELMCDGLLRQDKRKRFIIDIGTFGNYETIDNKIICFGCAATSTIQQIVNKNINANNIEDVESRAKQLNFSASELKDFEIVIDEARCGWVSRLMDFFEEDLITSRRKKWGITVNEWKSELPKIRKYIRDGRVQNSTGIKL